MTKEKLERLFCDLVEVEESISSLECVSDKLISTYRMKESREEELIIHFYKCYLEGIKNDLHKHIERLDLLLIDKE